MDKFDEKQKLQFFRDSFLTREIKSDMGIVQDLSFVACEQKKNFQSAHSQPTVTIQNDDFNPEKIHPLTRHLSWMRSNTRKLKAAIPETPYLLAGAFGGPFVISGLTPFRNAMTLGAQNRTSNILGLYKQVFQGGMFRGWTGGMYPGIAAVPQFMILGPFFHVCRQLGLPVPGAVLACGMAETMITFGTHTRNAQVAFLEANPGKKLPALHNPMKPWGVGMGVHVIRNAVALSGFRLVSGNIRDPLEALVEKSGHHISRGKMNVISDFSGCIVSAILSAPINQCYNFIVTTPELRDMTKMQRVHEIRKYLNKQYFDPKTGRITAVVRRDLAMRCIYVGCAFSTYGFIEREAVEMWKHYGSGHKKH